MRITENKKRIGTSIIAMLAGLSMICSMTSCGDSKDSSKTDSNTEATTVSTEAEETTAAEVIEDVTEPPLVDYEVPEPTEREPIEIVEGSALAVLTDIWGAYPDEEKFPVAGGDMSEEHTNMEGPGIYEDTAEATESMLHIPADQAENIDEIASMVHMMNTNTFTSAVVNVTDAEKVGDVAKAIEDCIKNTQWVCGMPDKFVFYTKDTKIIFALGEKDIVDTFSSVVLNTVSDAVKGSEEIIVAE